MEHAQYIKNAEKVVRLNQKVKIKTPQIDWKSSSESETLISLGLDKYNDLWQKTRKLMTN